MTKSTPKKKPGLSFETLQLRKSLGKFLGTPFGETGKAVGAFTCGVYAFFDYDGEPIYVGQTFESLTTRVRRHLTNQRTDAVAMSVLDPFEVCEIELFPLVQFDGVHKKHPDYALARDCLNELELKVFRKCLNESSFAAILNEKNPRTVSITRELPVSAKQRVVPDEVYNLRSHQDVRLARRAQTIARLAQVISERQVQPGLRRTLLVQAQRLEILARRQFEAWGGEQSVPDEPDDEE